MDTNESIYFGVVEWHEAPLATADDVICDGAKIEGLAPFARSDEGSLIEVVDVMSTALFVVDERIHVSVHGAVASNCATTSPGSSLRAVTAHEIGRAACRDS